MVKYLNNDEDFGPSHFPASAGFTGSRVGRHDSRDHNAMNGRNDSGDGGYPEREMAKGGRAKLAFGGEPTQPMPGPMNVSARPGALNQSAVMPPNANRIQAARNLVAAARPTPFRTAAAQAPAELMAPRAGAATMRPPLNAGAPTAMNKGGRIRRAEGGPANHQDWTPEKREAWEREYREFQAQRSADEDSTAQGGKAQGGRIHRADGGEITRVIDPPRPEKTTDVDKAAKEYRENRKSYGDRLPRGAPIDRNFPMADPSIGTMDSGEYGIWPTKGPRLSEVSLSTGGRIKRADGGPIYNADPQTTAMMQQGVQPQVQQGLPPQVPGQPFMQQQPMAQPPGMPGTSPVGMAKGGFIKKAVKYPGRMREGAAREGVSTHQYMEEKKHSPDPLLRAAANLGLRLTHGDLSPHRKGK